MAAKLTYTCDICGAVKKDTNHWFAVNEKAHNDNPNFPIEIYKWPNNDEVLKTRSHLCGEGCLLLKITYIINTKAVSLDE